MSSAPWAKVWWTWYTSRSHIGLSGVALALGAPLMLICRAAAQRHSDGHSDAQCDGACDTQSDVTRDLVWVRDKAGRPITAAKIAAIARFSVADVESALAELVDAETLVLSADGVYGFPNFWRYQESAAAARTRKYRGHKSRHSDGHSDAQCDGESDGACDDKRLEVRGKSKREDPSPSAPVSGLVAKPVRDDPVFTHWVKVMSKDPARSKLNAARKAKLKARRSEGYTDEQLCQAIDGCKLSPFHMGQNDRGEAYTDLATILRDGTTVEKHIERSTPRPSAAPLRWVGGMP
jgi:hypothetical protein